VSFCLVAAQELRSCLFFFSKPDFSFLGIDGCCLALRSASLLVRLSDKGGVFARARVNRAYFGPGGIVHLDESGRRWCFRIVEILLLLVPVPPSLA